MYHYYYVLGEEKQNQRTVNPSVRQSCVRPLGGIRVPKPQLTETKSAPLN